MYKVGDTDGKRGPETLARYVTNLRRKLQAGDGVYGKYESVNQVWPWAATTQNKSHWLAGRATGELSPFVPFEKQN